MQGVAAPAARRDVLLRWWAPGACLRAVYYSLMRDRIAPCSGECKTGQLYAVRPRPCGYAWEEQLGLVPPELRRAGGAGVVDVGPLFGWPCELPVPPGGLGGAGGRGGGRGGAGWVRVT